MHQSFGFTRPRTAAAALVLALVALLSYATSRISGQSGAQLVKGQALGTLLSPGGMAMRQATRGRAPAGPLSRFAAPIGVEGDDRGLIPTNELGLGSVPADAGPGSRNHPNIGPNAFVNDPCLDPPPTAPFPDNFRRTTQSETEIAVLNRVDGADDSDDDRSIGNEDGDDDGHDRSGALMVAGYNDSYGFYNNTQGLSGFSYSTDGGRSWIDGGGLPPVVATGLPAGTAGQDAYFGDPVVVVHHRSKIFYYASIYQQPDGIATISVNRGKFRVAPAQGIESKANTRCLADPSQYGVPDPPARIRKRIIWEPPVAAVPAFDPGDFIDKEWLYVDQRTGELYLAYVRFAADGSTPLELVRSFDGGRIWTPPSVIVPNLDDTFNTGVQPITTPTGRVIVSWWARTFSLTPPNFPEVAQRIEEAYSDDDGVTFSAPIVVASVNPQREPLGYNRGRAQIANMPSIAVDKGRDDGTRPSREDRRRPGYGNVYITYFDGRTPFPTRPFARDADIHLSRSTTNGASWGPELEVNDDHTPTSHVFPSVQVNQHGTVFVSWIDRRVDPGRNLLNDTWGALSDNRGASFGGNFRITDVSTDWLVRADARPNFGDYNSSAVIDFENFASIWSDGRFPPGTFVDRGRIRRAATPDSLFAIVSPGGSHSDHDDR